ncbi:MAG: hypothetical protein ACXADF_14530 [Candidatus Thorarchaeota archaeon]|jgi:hypothetical protein
MIEKWITGRILKVGDVRVSQRGKNYSKCFIEYIQDGIKVQGHLMLMGKALTHWHERLVQYAPIYNQDSAIQFKPAIRDEDDMGRGVVVPLFFVFNKWHFKQTHQGDMDKYVYPTGDFKRELDMKAFARKLEEGFKNE